jgi:hypothetical protein
MRILAGSASAVAAVMLTLAGCAAAGPPTADTMPRPASQTAAGHARQAATQAGTAVRLASPRLKCADPVAAGRAPGGAGGARGTTGQARQMTTLGGSVSPAPVATASRGTVQAGVVHLSQPGVVVLCGPVTGHCPPGYRAIYPRVRSGGRPPELLPFRLACVAPVPLHTMPPDQFTPVPVVTRPLHTMPPQD